MAARKQKLHRRDRPRLQELGAEGLSDRSIAALMNMTLADFRKALRQDPQSEIRLAKGRAEHERTAIGRLRQLVQAKGPQAITPTIFSLKQHGWSDRPTPEKQQSNVNVLVLPAAASAEAYRKQLAAAREAVTAEVLEDGSD